MGLGDESRCMQCHQGRHSTVSVNAGIEEAGLTDSPDEISEDLGFSNIHYYAAAATQYGTMANINQELDAELAEAGEDANEEAVRADWQHLAARWSSGFCPEHANHQNSDAEA